MHRLFEVDGIEHLDAVAAALQQLSGFQQHGAFRVGHDVGAVHLHEIGLDEKARLTGTGAADHQHVFIARCFRVFRAVVHRQFLRLRQNDIVSGVRVNVGRNVLMRSP